MRPRIPDRDGTEPSTTTLQEITPGEWYSLLARFDDASIYQTLAYGTCHWSPEQLRSVTIERKGRLMAMAQLRILRVPFLKVGIAYLRWAPLCRLKGDSFNAADLKVVMSVLMDEFVNRRGLILRVLPPAFQGDAHAAALSSTYAALGFRRTEQGRVFRTMRLDLSSSLGNLRKGLDGKWRNMLNSAERNGLVITEGADLELYDRFLAAYREMIARKKFETSVDVTEFRQMQMDLPAPFKMQIFLCLKDGEVLNAAVLSAIGDTGIYLLGATSDEGLKLKGAYLLQWRAIQWLKERGCRWYDLGGVNPVRNPGVYHFKQGLGGEETDHVGTFEASPGLASAFCVKAGERLHSMVHRLRPKFGLSQ